MISPEIYKFLNNLAANNNREWFQDNKKVYQECKESFSYVVELLIHLTAKIDSSVKGLTPKDCIFRINRDIRFSKDKSPYKTNFGAFIAPGGRNRGTGGYYIHVEPNYSMLAGGIYMPASPVLKAIRQEIFDNYDEFLSIVSDEEFVACFNGIEGEKLKTKPKGFPDDFVGIEYLKFKHYGVQCMYNDKEMQSDNFVNEVKRVFGLIYPLNRFLNYAIKPVLDV